jgi:hypothetical protein
MIELTVVAALVVSVDSAGSKKRNDRPTSTKVFH